LLVKTSDEYFYAVFHEFTREIAPNQTIKKFANNTEVIGAFAEGAVRRLVQRMVEPMRVSTGAVIGPDICLEPTKVPQTDLIIWAPNPLPAIFEAGEFALVPQRSVVGAIEIKRSNYSGVSEKLAAFTANNSLTPPILNEVEILVPTEQGRLRRSTLGVVCLRDTGKSDQKLDELIEQGAVACLMHGSDSTYEASTDGTILLLNFLSDLRRAYRLRNETSLWQLRRHDGGNTS
jgi:hypothetical protein